MDEDTLGQASLGRSTGDWWDFSFCIICLIVGDF